MLNSRGLPLQNDSDAAIVARVLEGDSAAYTALVTRYKAQYARFAARMLGNREDAEEALQDSFVRAYRSLAMCDDPARFGSWLFRILANRCRTSGARRGRREKTFVRDEIALLDASEDHPEERAAWREEIQLALAQLDDDQREAFLLKHVEEMGYEEMSELTRVGVSALKMRVKRACERLRVLLRRPMVSEHEIDPFIEDIAAELKRPVRFDSTLEARVMAAIEPLAESRSVERKSSTPWILRPRTLYVSPLAGLAVAAGLVAIITMSVLRTRPNATVASAVDTTLQLPNGFIPVSNPAAPVMVAAPFTYIDRNAKSVAVVGSFNDWDSTKTVLTQTSDGVWSGSAMIFPGRYEYQLVVDGKWIADPTAQQTAASEFGAANSVLIVSPMPR